MSLAAFTDAAHATGFCTSYPHIVLLLQPVCHRRIRRPMAGIDSRESAREYQVAGAVYFTVEGNIGAGKSTLLPQLAAELGWDYVLEDIDSDTRFHELVRQQYDGEIEPVAVDRYLIRKRAELVSELSNERHAIIERSLISSVVFNRANQGCDSLYREIMDSVHTSPKPAGMIYLAVSPDTAMTRVRKRARQAEDNLSIDYLETIHQGHEQWLPRLADELNIPLLTVDCNGRPDVKALAARALDLIN